MRNKLLILRMTLFQLGFAFLSTLVLGVLNRVMYAEMGLPATLVGFLLAIPPAVSPLRLWLGYLSDAHPILGHRRLPYIIGGMVLAVAGVFAGILGALWILRTVVWGILVTVLAFLGYGMGKSATATTFEALVADVFDEQRRPQATVTLRATFILGIIGGSVGLGRLMDPYSPGRLIAVAAGTGAVAIGLSVLGCLGVEPTGQIVESASSRVREMPFGQTLKLTFRNPQVRLFFFFIGATLLATLAQDVYLEPYGAKVFGMSVGQTARLSMHWGTGTLAAMMLCGLWLINRLGRKLVTAIGLVIVALSFVGLILVGGTGHKGLFITMVFLLGVGSGASGAGALTLMVDFTIPEQAGLLMGTWTIAHQLAATIGNALGGVLIDGVLTLSNSYLAAFGTLFGLEVVAALIALALLSRISVSAFRAQSSVGLEGVRLPQVAGGWTTAVEGEG